MPGSQAIDPRGVPQILDDGTNNEPFFRALPSYRPLSQARLTRGERVDERASSLVSRSAPR